MVVAQVLALLVSSNLLVAGETDTQSKRVVYSIFGPTHEDSQAVRHVRGTSEDSTDYEEQEEHVKHGRKKMEGLLQVVFFSAVAALMLGRIGPMMPMLRC